MAQILPESPLATTSPEVVRVHRLLKQLPDEDYVVWHRLYIHAGPGPDFWVLYQGRRSLFIKVCALSPAGARRFGLADLFGSEAGRPADAEHAALLAFARPRTKQTGRLLGQIPGWIVFPNLPRADLRTLERLANIPPGMTWVAREELSGAPLQAKLGASLGAPLSPEQVSRLREVFTPEVVIPATFTVRKPIVRNTAAQSTLQLMDYDQERVLKSDLELTAEGRATATDFGLRLVNGVAGSGKSLIVVYRAMLLRRLYPDKQILGLTHNRPLTHDLQARFQALSPDTRPVRWKNFNQWCRMLWPKKQAWRDPVGHSTREQTVVRVWQERLADTAISERMLLEEIDWIKDRLIFSMGDYAAADRVGRRFALNEAQRTRVYEAFRAYQAELKSKDQVDWGDVPRMVWRWVQEGRIRLPQYD
ncbi:MAG: hypothetical protein FJZ97_02875, partial [Chloroflexi bacterium]|nr:hypothetical protein [Chloroflexota bacterium]